MTNKRGYMRDYMKLYRKNEEKRIKELKRQKEYRMTHQDQIKTYKKAYILNHKEQISAYRRKYYLRKKLEKKSS